MKKTSRSIAVACAAALSLSLISPANAVSSSLSGSLSGSLDGLFGSWGPAPQPNPKPNPQPKPQPNPQPTPQPIPEPKPEPKPNPEPNPKPDNKNNSSIIAQEAEQETNKLRAKNNPSAPALKHVNLIQQDCQKWADHLAKNKVFEHDPELKTKFKYVYAENIAWFPAGALNGKEIVSAWANSPGHRANMLNSSWDLSAVAVSQASDGSWYAVARYTNEDRFNNYHPANQ